MCDEERSFQEALDRDPDDHVTRLVFSDWLEERGDVRCEGYRCLGVVGKYPEGRKLWYWYTHWPSSEPHETPRGTSGLPRDWWESMLTKQTGFPTRREAEDAAATAFAKLPPERRRELLNPEGTGDRRPCHTGVTTPEADGGS